MLNREDVLFYYERLKTHDWFYYYSDDPIINARGLLNEREIRKYSEEYKLFRIMYNDFNDAKYKGLKIPNLEIYYEMLKEKK